MADPSIKIQVFPGSHFCIKVLTALEQLKLPYEVDSLHPAKLKKLLPAPHLVPVMHYSDGVETHVVPDSSAILKFLGTTQAGATLYPNPLSVPVGAWKKYKSVEDMDYWATERFMFYYIYFGACTKNGRKTVLEPFLRQLLPKFLVRIVPSFLSSLGAKVGSKQLLTRVEKQLGKKAVASEHAVEHALFAALRQLETFFETDSQQYLFGTQHPTAADFTIFATLKRLTQPLPELQIGPGYPALFSAVGSVPRLVGFTDRMDQNFYAGRIDWTASIRAIT